jgi:hypothetical protein
MLKKYLHNIGFKERQMISLPEAPGPGRKSPMDDGTISRNERRGRQIAMKGLGECASLTLEREENQQTSE